MRKLVLLLSVFCIGTQFAIAQKDSGNERPKRVILHNPDAAKAGKDAAVANSGNSLSAVSANDVGEADSFGKNAMFLGTASAGTFFVYSSCDPAVLNTDLGIVLGPDDRCLAAPDPAVTASATFNDVGRIRIPKNSAENVFYLIANHTINYEFQNFTGANVSGNMIYVPGITIESEALNDPAAINPDTGLPMNGSFTTTGSGTKSVFKILPTGAEEIYTDSYTRANTTGLSRSYFAALGLPNHVINQLFKKPMTIHLNIRVSARRVPFAQYIFSMRVLGN